MSSMQTRIVLICVVVLAVGGAVVYGLYRLSGAGAVKGIQVAQRPELPRAHGGQQGNEEKPFAQYRAITDRNVFKPLVTEPAPAPVPGLNIPTVVPPPTRTFGPPPKPDPFANLAMTGVVERGRGRLQALITDTNTGQGRYAGKGEEAFGARVLDIRAKAVKVEKYGQTRELALGANAPKEGTKTTSGGTEARGPEMSGPSRGPGMPGMSPEEMRARFGGSGGREAFIRRMRERGLRSGC